MSRRKRQTNQEGLLRLKIKSWGRVYQIGRTWRNDAGKIVTDTLLIDADIDGDLVSSGSIREIAGIVGVEIDSIRFERSQSGGKHYIVTLVEPVSPAEAIAIQLAMGDDRKRGAMNLGRVLSGADLNGAPWNILYSQKVYTRKELTICQESERI